MKINFNRKSKKNKKARPAQASKPLTISQQVARLPAPSQNIMADGKKLGKVKKTPAFELEDGEAEEKALQKQLKCEARTNKYVRGQSRTDYKVPAQQAADINAKKASVAHDSSFYSEEEMKSSSNLQQEAITSSKVTQPIQVKAPTAPAEKSKLPMVAGVAAAGVAAYFLLKE